MKGAIIAVVLVILFIIVLIVVLAVILIPSGGNKNSQLIPLITNTPGPSGYTPGDYAPVLMCSKDLKSCADDSSSSGSDCGCSSESSSSGCCTSESSSSGCCSSGSSSCSDRECFSLEGCNRRALYGKGNGCGTESPVSEYDYFSNFDKCIISLCDQPSQIRDITQDGANIVYLVKANTSQISVWTKKGTYRVTSSMSLDRIIGFDGDVYALKDGKLYSRDPESVNRRLWYWTPVAGAPDGIIWIAITLDNCHMWIQTSSNKGYLLNKKLSIGSPIEMPDNTIRVYGRTSSTSANLDTKTNYLTINSNGKRFGNVGDFIYTWNNAIVLIRPPQKSVVSGIRLVNWKPYFLLN